MRPTAEDLEAVAAQAMHDQLRDGQCAAALRDLGYQRCGGGTRLHTYVCDRCGAQIGKFVRGRGAAERR